MDTRHPRRLLPPEQVLMRFSIIYDRPSTNHGQVYYGLGRALVWKICGMPVLLLREARLVIENPLVHDQATFSAMDRCS